MASRFFTKAVERLMGDGTLDLKDGTIKCALLDLNDVDTWVKAIGSSTNATPIEVTITSHGLTTGDLVLINGHATNTNANGIRRVTSTGANTFTLQDPDTGANIAGNGVGVSTGTVMNLTNGTTGVFLADVNAGVVGTAQTLTSKTVTGGVWDAADLTYSLVTGDQFEAMLFYEDTGDPATSICIFIIDNGTGLPFTPSGGNITVTFAATGIAKLS